MKIKELKKDEAEKKLKQFLTEDPEFFNDLDEDYKALKKEIETLFYTCAEYKDDDEEDLDEYKTDLAFSLKLYELLNSKDWFNETVASNYDFWSYLCVCVCPDIVYDRHGENPEYYYKKNVRIYLPTMWWYIHMSWQGSIEKTRETLSKLNTDYILQLVERPGRDGLFLTICRRIMYYIGILPKEILETKVDNKNLLRRVLIQNTSKISNYNLVFDNNEDLYVKSLFSACGVEVDNYERN